MDKRVNRRNYRMGLEERRANQPNFLDISSPVSFDVENEMEEDKRATKSIKKTHRFDVDAGGCHRGHSSSSDAVDIRSPDWSAVDAVERGDKQ